MSVIVQRTYAPQQRPAVVGDLADMTGWDAITRIVETAAGVGYGLAVSIGANSDKGCVLGGSKFLGITLRDITLIPGSTIDPMYSGIPPTTPDIYPQYFNAGVLTRGRIWVAAGAKVAAGDPLFYNTTSGLFTNAAGGVSATDSLAFTVNPVDGNTVVINGTTVTFKASGATGLQVNVGPTLGDTLLALASFINGSADVNITKVVAEASPPSPGGAGQGSGANTLLLSDKTLGTAGNAYTLTAGTTPGVTVGGATFAGGAAGGTAVTGGFWVTSTAVSGDLAIASLSVQR